MTPPIPRPRDPDWADHLDEHELLTLTELGEALGVDRITLHGWVRRNLLHARYISDEGHPMYNLGQAHAVMLRIKLRGRRIALHPNAAGTGWARPKPGKPWVLDNGPT